MNKEDVVAALMQYHRELVAPEFTHIRAELGKVNARLDRQKELLDRLDACFDRVESTVGS